MYLNVPGLDGDVVNALQEVSDFLQKMNFRNRKEHSSLRAIFKKIGEDIKERNLAPGLGEFAQESNPREG